jgi:flagellin
MIMSVINTNIAASVTANSMRENQRTMENTMERLATGKRINSASDDAAGLAIGERMESQIRGMQQASRNSNDAISMIQTADGAAIEIGEMLQRMRELAVQARNGTNESQDITNLNKEFAQLATEIERIANDTKFNGSTLLEAGTVKSFVVGADEADTIDITFGDFNLAAGGQTAVGETIATGNLTISEGDLQTDLNTAGFIELSDGTTILQVSLADIQVANGDNTISGAAGSNDATMAEIVLAVNNKAAASADFTAVVTANGTAGFTLTEKAGKGGANDTYTIGGIVANQPVTLSGGQVGSASGVLGVDMTTYAASASVTVDDSSVIGNLDTAIVNVAGARADFGAVINRLEYTIDNLNSGINNTKAAKSQIVDADYAQETTELARTQIISQASTAMLSQANQAAQSVLALLK